jgi:actin-related protein
LFENYGVNELNLTPTVPLILASEGIETGLGIDLGDGATQVSSVIGGI